MKRPKLIHPAAGERGMTELHFAAYCQNLEDVKRCVKAGFDVNEKDDGGWTPLVWCIDMAATGAKGAAESIVDYLVEHGARLEYSDSHFKDILAFAHNRDSWVAEHIEKIIAKKRKSRTSRQSQRAD